MLALHNVEIFVGLSSTPCSRPSGIETCSQSGYKNVDLVGIVAQRRKTGRVPGNIERRADSFPLIQLDLRRRQLRFAVRAGRRFL